MSDASSRNLILHMSVSIDGFISSETGEMPWFGSGAEDVVDHSDRRHRANVEMVSRMGLVVIGRGAYEGMVQAWPGSDSPMGRFMNETPKVVFSETLKEVEWVNAQLNERPLREEIETLKTEAGRDIVAMGVGRLAHSLIEENLIDEYRLTVQPFALGSGISLMHGLPEPRRFELVSSTTYADGAVVQVLRPG